MDYWEEHPHICLQPTCTMISPLKCNLEVVNIKRRRWKTEENERKIGDFVADGETLELILRMFRNQPSIS